jgi:CrcB protein
MLPRKHWGTFVVNVTACFSLGLVLAQVERCGPITGLALLIGVGFLGSLSTFSTFVMEVFNELRAGEALLALVLMFASLLMGLVAAAAGYGLGSYG